MNEEQDIEEIGDISVPTELLELHLELEEQGLTAADLQEITE